VLVEIGRMKIEMNRITRAMFAALALACLSTPLRADETGQARQPASQFITLGGGCFWCVEAVFERLEGVRNVVSGYAGGTTQNPTYDEVTTGRTGHAEVVQIEFDPAQISLDRLLDVFWETHDPTTLNRQGADVGTHYRSIILAHDDAQRAVAEKSKRRAAIRFQDAIVTELVSLTKFYPAEEYHQDYFKKNPNAPYCAVVIRPKLRKLELFLQKPASALEETAPLPKP
jgi:peptide-methionine (S)-S-oxide reductase